MQAHKRRILLSGFSILALSLLAGIAVSLYQWDRGSPFDTSTWQDGFNPIGRAILPLVLIVMFFPFTVPVILVLLVPVYIGFKKEKLWPVSLIGFAAMGVLWVLLLTELWTMD